MDSRRYACLIRKPNSSEHWRGYWARRKPVLLLRLSGLFLLRFAERRLSCSLFQEPQRSTRHQSGPSPLEYYRGKNAFTQAQGLRMFGMAYPALHTGINVIPY